MKRGVAIEDYLKPLAPEQTQCYLTDTLQVADIVEWALAQIGRSTIWQTSFSISEEFIRRLYFISKSGNVDRIHLVLDFKATQKTLRLWAFITQVIEHAYLADNHSKVILIQPVAAKKKRGRTALGRYHHVAEPHAGKPLRVSCRHHAIGCLRYAA